MAEEEIPSYLLRAQSGYVEPKKAAKTEKATEAPPAPAAAPVQVPEGHTPQWRIEYPNGVSATDSITSIDRYVALKEAWLNKMLLDLATEQEHDERLLSPDARVRRPVQDHYSRRRSDIRLLFQAFNGERATLGVGRRESVKKRHVRQAQREKSRDADLWMERTLKDYQDWFPDQTRQQVKKAMDADRRAAQGGDLEAYIRLNGFTTGDENARLELDPCHHDMIACYTADLKCRSCGRYHGGELREQNPDGTLKGPTCPHCGLENCQGPLRSKMKAPRGLGKTELKAHETAMRTGMMLQRKRWPRVVVLGDNDQEADMRAEMVATIMSRPGHYYVFDRELPPSSTRPHNHACVPRPKHQKGNITFYGGTGAVRNEPVIVAYGILGLPPGYHADLFWCDDCVNYKNTFLKPGLVQPVIDAWTNVVTKSERPWTVIGWTGTPWLQNDLDALLTKEADENPDQWATLTIDCGGPEDGFRTPSPRQLPPAKLKEQYDLQERTGGMSYDRAYRMRIVDTSRVAFTSFHYYVHLMSEPSPDLGKAIEESKIPVVRGVPAGLDIPKLMAIDVGFTSGQSDKKGRSKTGMVIGGMVPEFGFLFEALEDFLTPRQVKEIPIEWCKRFGCKEIVVALGPGMEETVQHFIDAGLTVHRISETQLGDKTLRKFPIAETHNSGLVRFRSWPRPDKHGGLKVGGVSELSCLEEACLMYPLEVRDVLDAYEFWRREMWRLHGPPKAKVETLEAETEKPYNRLAAHQDAVFRSAQEEIDRRAMASQADPSQQQSQDQQAVEELFPDVAV